MSTGASSVASELFDTKGRRWKFKQQFAAWADGYPSLDTSGNGSYVADTLSDDELAEALRPARLHGNAEYVLDIPHDDLVSRVRSARAKVRAGDGYDHPGPLDVARTLGSTGDPSATTVASADVALRQGVFGAALESPLARAYSRRASLERGAPLGPGPTPRPLGSTLDERRGDVTVAVAEPSSDPAPPMFPQDVLGTDTRSFVTHSGVSNWPNGATIAFGTWVSGAGVLNGAHCSANLIGYYTAVTAAHCFWDRFEPNPYPLYPIANGVVTSGTPTGTPPNVVWLISSQTRRTNPTQCYDRYYPSGWTTYFSWDFDYGVIEFGCLPFPGINGNQLRSGYLTNFNDYTMKPVYLEAYDNIAQDTTTSNLYSGYADPSLRTRYDGATGAVSVNGFNTRFLETTRIDVTHAASGGCVRQQLYNVNAPYNWYCSGVVSHGNSSSTQFRRLDYEFMVYIQSFSEY